MLLISLLRVGSRRYRLSRFLNKSRQQSGKVQEAKARHEVRSFCSRQSLILLNDEYLEATKCYLHRGQEQYGWDVVGLRAV